MVGPLITIGSLVSFAPTVGVRVHPDVLDCSPATVFHLLAVAFKHVQDPELVAANCGARGPLAPYAELTFAHYVELLKAIRTKPVPYKKQAVSEELRWTVWERDNFTCRHCGIRAFLSCDHIVPESAGGETTLDNLQTLCRSCNSKKGATR